MNQTVSILGIPYTTLHLLRTAEGQHILQLAYATQTPIYCTCNGDESPPLILTWPRKKRMWLSRVRDSGPSHSKQCDDYEEPAALELRMDHRHSASAIEQVDDRFSVRMNLPLTHSFTPGNEHSVETKDFPGKKDRRNTSMFGLLSFALHHSGLCTIHPADAPRRGTQVMARSITTALSRVDMGNNCLLENFIIPRLDNQSDVSTKLARIRQHPAQTIHKYIFAIGSLFRYEVAGDIVKVWLDNWLPPFQASFRLWESATKHSMSANIQKALQDIKIGMANCRVLVIGRTEVTSGGACRFLDMSLLVTSPEWIPVLSEYELQFVAHVVENKRWYWKPAIPDPALEYFVDGVLLDVEPEHWCEVKGIRSRPKYETRWTKKVAEINRLFPGRLSTWNAVAGDPFPALPTANRK